jgi:recombination protein RecA
MPSHFATLRAHLELALAGRVAAPFAVRDPRGGDQVTTGIPEIDGLVGGLPRGALTEIYGPACSGRTSLLFSALSARTAQAEACALIDSCDAFDPHSAQAAGINLQQLLWVRCQNLEQSFRATDFLLQAGGFGCIALDVSDVPRESVQRVPLDTWFRFRKAVEGTPTILLVLEQEAHAKTCASLVLKMKAEQLGWQSTHPSQDPDAGQYPFSTLLDGCKIRAELIRTRLRHGFVSSVETGAEPRASEGRSAVFEANEIWSL